MIKPANWLKSSALRGAWQTSYKCCNKPNPPKGANTKTPLALRGFICFKLWAQFCSRARFKQAERANARGL
ncbi:hypothetical protein BN341_17740 [Helicobacter heilmannii ASB1.4]|nr:hypothetical protein BN341_17740 [Helicobacter heilmannii ASB1.4]